MVWHQHGDDPIAIGFQRRDALVRETAPLGGTAPGALPVPLGDGQLCGPSVLDTLAVADGRVTLRGWDEVMANTGVDAVPGDRDMAASAMAALHVPGAPVDARGDFEIVDKPHQVRIPRLIVRLAAAMYGDEAEARARIATLAAQACEYELERCLYLYMAASRGPSTVTEPLQADVAVEREVGNQILREACATLGVGPDGGDDAGLALDQEARGSVVRLGLLGDGTLHGELLVGMCGLGAETVLHALTEAQVVRLRTAVTLEGLRTDTDLLSSFLDTHHPGWRERAASARSAAETGEAASSDAAGPDADAADPRTAPGALSAGMASDPFEILGLDRRTATPDDVKHAYRHAIKAAHPDTSGLPGWFARSLKEAHDAALDALAETTGAQQTQHV